MRTIAFVSCLTFPAAVSSLAPLHFTAVSRREAFRSLVLGPIVTTATMALDPMGVSAAVVKDNTAAIAMDDTGVSSTPSNCRTWCMYRCESTTNNSNNNRQGRNNESCIQGCQAAGNEYSTACHDDPPASHVREPELLQSRTSPGLYHRWQDDD